MIQDAKFSGYYFYMNTNIGNFQICISVPFRAIRVFFSFVSAGTTILPKAIFRLLSNIYYGVFFPKVVNGLTI